MPLIGQNYLLEGDGDNTSVILLEDGTPLLLEEAPTDLSFNNFLNVSAGDGISVGGKVR